MIKWAELKMPPINLWSAPRQEKLRYVLLARFRARVLRARIKSLKNMQVLAEHELMQTESKIKEREFLYYLHSGRFPE